MIKEGDCVDQRRDSFPLVDAKRWDCVRDWRIWWGNTRTGYLEGSEIEVDNSQVAGGTKQKTESKSLTDDAAENSLSKKGSWLLVDPGIDSVVYCEEKWEKEKNDNKNSKKV